MASLVLYSSIKTFAYADKSGALVMHAGFFMTEQLDAGFLRMTKQLDAALRRAVLVELRSHGADQTTNDIQRSRHAWEPNTMTRQPPCRASNLYM